MDERQAFIDKIIEEPDNNDIRMVFADWLDQNESSTKQCSGTHRHEGRAGAVIHGVTHDSDPRKPHHHCDAKCWVSNGYSARARFIRLQCEVTRVISLRPCEFSKLDTCFDRRNGMDDVAATGCANCKELVPLKREVIELLGENRYPWCGIPAKDLFMTELNVEWFGGFIEKVKSDIETLRRHLPTLVKSHPIQEVAVEDLRPWDEDGSFCWWEEWNTPAEPYQGEMGDLRHWLFNCLWERAMESEKTDLMGRRWLRYPSVEVANDCLSDGLIEWAKQQSGRESSRGQQPERIASD